MARRASVREVRILERGDSGLGLPQLAEALRVLGVRPVVQRPDRDVSGKLEGPSAEVDLRAQGDGQGTVDQLDCEGPAPHL